MRSDGRGRVGGAALLVVSMVSSCGGSDGGSGVASSKRLTELSDGEKGELCDWLVNKAGSYGNPGTCDRTQSTPATYPFLTWDDQAACIEDAVDATDADCVATVAQMEACVNRLPACATLSDAAAQPLCAVLEGC
jgi:hypothetical protein